MKALDTKMKRFCNFLLRIGKTGQNGFGAGITNSNGSAVTHFPGLPPVWRQNRTHSVFALRTISHAWRARWLQQKLFFAKPRGLENTHDAVMHVHKLVVSTPNKRAQTRETFFRSSKDMPQRWFISPFWAKKTSKSWRRKKNPA
jgi:hypothetical protein